MPFDIGIVGVDEGYGRIEVLEDEEASEEDEAEPPAWKDLTNYPNRNQKRAAFFEFSKAKKWKAEVSAVQSMQRNWEKTSVMGRRIFQTIHEPPVNTHGPKIVQCRKTRSMPEGRSSLGITALICEGKGGSSVDPTVSLRLDSGADITLISEEFWRSLKAPPKLQQGMKLWLYALTNEARILGYVMLKIYIPTQDGTLLEMETEAYVVPGMKVLVLLGEDFQVNYQISVHRRNSETKLSIEANRETFWAPASSGPNTIDKGFEIR